MKYLKPKSLTWWASFVPILAGTFLALEPVHGLAVSAEVLRSMTGSSDPYVLINAGLIGIGLRGAL